MLIFSYQHLKENIHESIFESWVQQKLTRGEDKSCAYLINIKYEIEFNFKLKVDSWKFSLRVGPNVDEKQTFQLFKEF